MVIDDAERTTCVALTLDTDRWLAAGERAVHPSRRDRSEPLVTAIAEGLAAVAVPWELATDDSPDERRYQLIVETDAYDAWLIHWPADSALEAHDHGGSAGAFAVVSGLLEEHYVVGDLEVTRRVGAGESVFFGADHVHAVVNPNDAVATSVHVYTPPLRSMGFYRADDGALLLDRVDVLAG